MGWQPSQLRLESMIEMTAELRRDPRPQWLDVRERLKDEDVTPDDAAFGDWHSAGIHAMSGLIGTRDSRLFGFGVTYGFDVEGRPLEQGLGWVHRWEEIPRAEIKHIAGLPNSYAQAVRVAELVFEND